MILKKNKPENCPDCLGKGYVEQEGYSLFCFPCKGRGVLKKRKPRRTKTPVQKLVTECDLLWRDCIRLRDKGRCVYSLKAGNQAHHIFSRGNLATRWDIRNGVLLNAGIHRFVAHGKDRAKFNDFIKKRLGKVYNILKLKQNNHLKRSVQTLGLVRLKLQMELKEWEIADSIT